MNETPHTPPPGARAMNVVRWVIFAGLFVLAVGSVASYLLSRRPQSTATSSAHKPVRYYCPMHPSYTSDKPGECPICGMTLEPIPEGGAAARAGTEQRGDVPGLSDVHLTPERVQLIGVRFARVQRRKVGSGLQLTGFVAPDEAALRRVQIRAAGWVQKLVVSRTGEVVRAGDPLLSIYSPELYQSEQEFLIELSAGDTTAQQMHDRMPGLAPAEPGHEAGALNAARQRLRLLGVPAEEIARLEREHTASTQIMLRSPAAGTVIERNVAEGQYVGPDVPLLTVADLSRLWVLADLYEMDFTRVRVGDRARFTTDALPGRAFDSVVGFIYPTVSSDTRTLKVRLGLPNRDGLLRPGMYGRVEVLGRGVPVLAVPAEAVVNTGERRYVFVAHGGGHFEPRSVQVGAQGTEWVQILSGVAEGDTVVASASFLIDSESRLESAISGMRGNHP